MLIDDLKNIRSARRDLRNFGFIIAITFAVLAVILYWSGRGSPRYLVYVALAFAVAAVFCPLALKPLQKLWMAASVVMGWFTTRLVLCVLYFVVLTPTGLIAKLVGKNFLSMKIDKTRKTYWNARDAGEPPKSDYEKQF